MFLVMISLLPHKAHVCVITYLKTILTHRFTSTVIGSGELYSSRIRVFEANTHGGRSVVREPDKVSSQEGRARLPASCLGSCFSFLRFVPARVPSVFLLTLVEAGMFICDQAVKHFQDGVHVFEGDVTDCVRLRASTHHESRLLQILAIFYQMQ